MRGARQPALRPEVTVPQSAFRALSRHRRSRLARTARTTLVKADQWARGGELEAGIVTALESALQALQAKGGSSK
jgi:hypothetical protein